MATHTLTPPGTRRGGTPTGCPTSRPSRRELLGAAGFCGLAGIAALAISKPDAQAVEVLPAAQTADARLLALCDRFLVLQAALDASYAQELEQHDALKKQGALYKQLNALEMEGEAQRTPLQDEQVELLDQISDLTAATLPGQQARARVLMAWYALGNGCSGEHSSTIEWGHLAPLFRDLLGEAV